MSYKIRTRDEHFQDPGPKRILALDGGGTRGIVTLCYLKRIEEILWERHGFDPKFRLCHYFDLIAGTSTGSIIAAGLAQGRRVGELIRMYEGFAASVFRRDLFSLGLVKPIFDHASLERLLKAQLGEHVGLGSETLKTGLLVVSKRTDTGSTWPLGNNPRGAFYDAPEDETWIANKNYPLWKVVRASTAAPRYFDPEELVISAEQGKKPVVGKFVDGGVSPFNNPAFQAYMYATLTGYNLGWKSGPGDLLITSVGTGRGDPGIENSGFAALSGVNALMSMMNDTMEVTETLMQWFGQGPTHREIGSEMGDLKRDGTDEKRFQYLRYDLFLDAKSIDGKHRQRVNTARPELTHWAKEHLLDIDRPEFMELLAEFASEDAARDVDPAHFSYNFDLPI